MLSGVLQSLEFQGSLPLLGFQGHLRDLRVAEARDIEIVDRFPYKLGITLARLRRLTTERLNLLLLKKYLNPCHVITIYSVYNMCTYFCQRLSWSMSFSSGGVPIGVVVRHPGVRMPPLAGMTHR